MDEIRPSSLSIISNCQQSLISSSLQKKIKYKHYDYEESADFIIAVMGNSIKCEKAGVRNLFLTPALRL